MTPRTKPLVVKPWDAHNRALVDNVHPPGGTNPAPAPRYNLVVIGAGPAGLVTAIAAAGVGARVALIERGAMGGDCLNVGCVPSKALLRAARAWVDVRGAADFGFDVGDTARGDFGRVMERMRAVRAQLSVVDSAHRCQRLGVDVFLGAGRFTGPDTVEVAGSVLRFRWAVVATGARPAVPSIPGLADAGYLTNESVFELTTLPARLAVIGAGAVGCELAQAFARFGAEISLLESAPRILGRENADAGAVVAAALTRDGVRLLTGCAIERVERHGAERVVHYRAAGGPAAVRVDAVLVAAGRIPNVDDLGLDAAGVTFDARARVRVNGRLRTTNRRIYAAGDVCSRNQFTHNADAQARIVVRNALFFGRGRADAALVPRVTYTDPEIAQVGLSIEDARARGLRIRTFSQPFAKVDRAVLDGDPEGFAAVHVRAGSDRIVGATIVARHAGELISELTLAMAHRIGLGELGRMVYPYPTRAEALRKLGDACTRTRLTPGVKRIFERWFAWTR